MPAIAGPCTYAACSDGEEELYYNMLLEEDPVNKLSVNAVLGAVVLTATSVICWLCDADPAGNSRTDAADTNSSQYAEAALQLTSQTCFCNLSCWRQQAAKLADLSTPCSSICNIFACIATVAGLLSACILVFIVPSLTSILLYCANV